MCVGLATCWVAPVWTHPGNRSGNIRAQAIDTLFTTGVEPSYFSKLVLRFGDDITQWTFTVRQGGKAELTRLSLEGTTRAQFDRLILEAFENKTMSAAQVAARLRVRTDRIALDYERQLKPALDGLTKIRLTPLLPGRVALESDAEYEFGYDTWQESVHYTVAGPFDDSGNELVKWMRRMRAQASAWLAQR